MSFKPAFSNLFGATDALQSLANPPPPSPKLPQPADHLGTTAGNKLGVLANTKHITVKTLKCHSSGMFGRVTRRFSNTELHIACISYAILHLSAYYSQFMLDELSMLKTR